MCVSVCVCLYLRTLYTHFLNVFLSFLGGLMMYALGICNLGHFYFSSRRSQHKHTRTQACASYSIGASMVVAESIRIYVVTSMLPL